MSMKSILVAIAPEDSSVVSAIVGTEFNVVMCHSLREAEESLDEAIGLIACGVHFDQGSMFELLRAAKANRTTCSVPFFLLLREGTSHSPAVIHGIRSAAELLGVDVFIDLSELGSGISEQERYELLRQMARDVLLSPVMSHQA